MAQPSCHSVHRFAILPRMTTTQNQTTTFGFQLKRLRGQFDLTQEALAELASCSVQTIRFFESGRRRPSLEMAEHLAELLQVPPAERAAFVRLARTPVVAEPATPAISISPQVHTDTPAVALPVEAPTRYRPPSGTSLIGREGEFNVLRDLLISEQARLVTVLGTGGMGKTQLVLAVANALVEQYQDGVLFVPLASQQNAAQVPLVVADTLGLTLQGNRTVEEQVLAYLAERNLLLILDNFEHLLATVEEGIMRWLTALTRLSGVQLLITSRERLRLTGERVFELGGLALPHATVPTEQAGAVLLFVARAAQVDVGFALNADNRHVISRICQLVDGMPLALELAATWVRLLSCAEIADELERSIDFLVLADRDMPRRHHSMRAVFDHSWNLLNTAEQRVLAALSVFRGGCSRPAAQAVAGATLPLLATLIDKSLVRRMETDEGETRYDLHELTRQYAAQQLAMDSARRHSVQTAHAIYFAQWLAANPISQAGDAQMTILDQSERELDNLRTAWSFAIETAAYTVVQQMVNGLGELLFWRSHYHEAVALLQSAMQQLTTRTNHPVDVVTDAMNIGYLACEIETWLACFLTQIGQVPGGITLFANIQTRLEHLAEEGVDVLPCKIKLLSEQALFLFVIVGEYAEAYRVQQEVVTLCRQLSNEHQLARNLVRSSQLLHFLGRYREAIAFAEEAIAIAQRNADQLVLIGAMERLALIQTYQGNFAVAEPLFRGAVVAAEQINQPAKLASVLTNLGVSLVFQGQFQVGLITWQRALALSNSVGDQNYIVHSTLLAGFATLHLGDYRNAMSYGQAGIAKADGLGYTRDSALGRLLMGSAQLAMGHLDDAYTTVATSITYYQRISHPDELSWALAVQLYVLRAQGRQAELSTLATEALATVRNAEGFNAVQTLLPILALLLFDGIAVGPVQTLETQNEQTVELLIALGQSPFISQSVWFDAVAGSALQTHLTQLSPAMQSYVKSEVATGERRNTQVLLRHFYPPPR